jgi:hypothetical protein
MEVLAMKSFKRANGTGKGNAATDAGSGEAGDEQFL